MTNLLNANTLQAHGLLSIERNDSIMSSRISTVSNSSAEVTTSASTVPTPQKAEARENEERMRELLQFQFGSRDSVQPHRNSAFTTLLGKRAYPEPPVLIPPIMRSSQLSPLSLLPAPQLAFVRSAVVDGRIAHPQPGSNDVFQNLTAETHKCETPFQNSISTSFKTNQNEVAQPSPTQAVSQEDLTQSILNSIPDIFIHQGCTCGSCGVNKNLLQYFLNREFKERQYKTDKPDEAPLRQISEPNKVEDSTPNKVSSAEQASDATKSKALGQIVMQITKCPHKDRKHYAKNMCSSCYRKNGRSQNAWNCPHTERLLYSQGKCQTCYLSDYHKRKNKELVKANQAEEKLTLALSSPDGSAEQS